MKSLKINQMIQKYIIKLLSMAKRLVLVKISIAISNIKNTDYLFDIKQLFRKLKISIAHFLIIIFSHLVLSRRFILGQMNNKTNKKYINHNFVIFLFYYNISKVLNIRNHLLTYSLNNMITKVCFYWFRDLTLF